MNESIENATINFVRMERKGKSLFKLNLILSLKYACYFLPESSDLLIFTIVPNTGRVFIFLHRSNEIGLSIKQINLQSLNLDSICISDLHFYR